MCSSAKIKEMLPKIRTPSLMCAAHWCLKKLMKQRLCLGYDLVSVFLLIIQLFFLQSFLLTGALYFEEYRSGPSVSF